MAKTPSYMSSVQRLLNHQQDRQVQSATAGEASSCSSAETPPVGGTMTLMLMLITKTLRIATPWTLPPSMFGTTLEMAMCIASFKTSPTAQEAGYNPSETRNKDKVNAKCRKVSRDAKHTVGESNYVKREGISHPQTP